MPAGGSCLLGSINLSEFVTDDQLFDYEDFKRCVRITIEALNDVLDEGLLLHPLQEQRDSVRNWRQIGAGIFGLGDMLIKMGITYGSFQSIVLCNRIASTMIDEAIRSSALLAKYNGTYPKYKNEIKKSEFFIANTSEETRELVKKYGLRNSQLLTTAPTGTLSSMLGVSGGIEPIFANYYTRKTESLKGRDEYYKVYTPIVKKYMEEHGLKDDSELPEYFVTAPEINYKDRIRMQSIWQSHIDASISSTINLPNSATIDEIEQLYLYAWEQGLKGVTIFRDGCKRAGILTTDKNTKKENDKKNNNTMNHVETTKIKSVPHKKLERGMIIKADDNCIGKKRTLRTGCGTLHCEAFFDPDTGQLLETYFSKGSSGGCVDADTEYFNGSEWKRISDYKRGSGEKVLQYHENGVAELVEPIHYIVNDGVETLKHFTNKYGLDMVLSEDHRMFTYKNYTKFSMGIRNKLTTEIVTVDEYLKRNEKKERHIPTTFSLKTNGIPVTNKYIRLLVAIYADGTFDGNKIIISLKKDRKKDRMRYLLNACDIGYSERNIPKTDYTNFYIYPMPSIKEWFIDKQFSSKWYDCTDEQLSIIVDECVYWDGSVGSGNRLGEYYSSKKEEIDFMQFALHRLGYRASISPNNSTKSDKPSYKIRWTKQNVHNLKHAQVTEYKTVDGKSYCFTVPTGLLVLRRNNKIFITGNCNNFMIGLSRMISLCARGGVDIYSIVDQLKSSGTCPSYAVRRAVNKDTSLGSSCPVAIGNALIDMYEDMQNEINCDSEDEEELSYSSLDKTSNVVDDRIQDNDNVQNPCPQCGAELVFEGGCNVCKACGWSKCD